MRSYIFMATLTLGVVLTEYPLAESDFRDVLASLEETDLPLAGDSNPGYKLTAIACIWGRQKRVVCKVLILRQAASATCVSTTMRFWDNALLRRCPRSALSQKRMSIAQCDRSFTLCTGHGLNASGQ